MVAFDFFVLAMYFTDFFVVDGKHPDYSVFSVATDTLEVVLLLVFFCAEHDVVRKFMELRHGGVEGWALLMYKIQGTRSKMKKMSCL